VTQGCSIVLVMEGFGVSLQVGLSVVDVLRFDNSQEQSTARRSWDNPFLGEITGDPLAISFGD